MATAEVVSAVLPGQCTASVGASAPALGRPPVPLTAMLCATMCACVGVVLAMLMWRGLRGWRPPPKRTRLEVSRSAEATAATACPPTPEATAINAVCKGGDETGAVDACSAASWPETPTTLALAQRVEALGLHLGDICVTGISVGLPNGCSRRRVFDPSALDDLFSGQTMIGPVPHSLLTAQLDRNVVQVSKGPAGDRVRKPLSALHEVVQLASRIGHFDLADEFGIDPKIVETLDSTYALAIGAGLQALLDAGLVSPPPSASPPPQGPQNNNTGGGAHPTAGHTGGGGIRGDKPWRLKPSHQEETGVIFASSFPALDSLVDEVSRFLTSRLARACDGQRREMAAQLECLARELGEKEGGPVSELREALIGAARPRGGAGSAGGGEAGGGCVGEGYSGAGGGGGGATCAEGCEDQAGTGALGAVCAADAGNGHDTGREGLRVGVILGGSGGVNGRGGGMNGGGVTGGGLNGGRVNGGGTGGSEGSASGSGAGDGVSPPEYEFNRKLLFKLLVMANSQLAEIINARGPNLQINAACAGTTAAISLACDWLRAGRCARVVVIAADNPTSDHLFPWLGTGFLALGAASTKRDVTDAALPFDRRRNGMILGAGAVGMVIETDTAAQARPGRGKSRAKVLAAVHANSAFHASAIGTAHATSLLDGMLRQVETLHGISRSELARSLLYVSHETCTYARGGGCAGAEMASLRAAFGPDTPSILIANTKGVTGHAMGVCFEDAIAVAALSDGRVPPMANFREPDPALGQLNLSRGGTTEARYALHFAAGFGSQLVYVLYARA